jgi:hypothetical protein
MRRLAYLFVVSFVWLLIGSSPALAISFLIIPDGPFTTNGGTLSYAGGNVSLLGSNIGISSIVRSEAIGTPGDLTCVGCTLNFSTGAFANTIPASSPDPPGYSFSGGGSLQIIGGATSGLTPLLQPGTILFNGVITAATVSPNVLFGTESAVLVQGALNPTLASNFGLPANTSYAGGGQITTKELSSAPNAFFHTMFGTCTGDLCSFRVNPAAVPIPGTEILFGLGFIALVAWRECARVFPYRGRRSRFTGPSTAL